MRALTGTQPVSTPALSEGLLLPAEKEVKQKAARMMQEVMKAVEEINKKVEEEQEKLDKRGRRLRSRSMYVDNYKKFWSWPKRARRDSKRTVQEQTGV